VLYKKKAKVKNPILLFLGLVLAVVALGAAVLFYFWAPTTGVTDVKPVSKVEPPEVSTKVLLKEKRYDEAIAQFTKALAIDPGNVEVRMDRAAAYYTKQSFQDALSDYQRVLSECAATQDKIQDKTKSFFSNNALFGVALCQFGLERSEMAVKSLHELQAKDSHYVKSYQLLGDIYLKSGDSEAALDAYTQGLRLNPKSAVLHYDRAVAYMKRGMKGQAFADLSAAAELDKDSLPIRLMHANLAQKLSKLAIADSDAREILRLEPTNRSALAWLQKRNRSLETGESSQPPETKRVDQLPLGLEK
jgi:tetratricopeptide (TPR) repeat protein